MAEPTIRMLFGIAKSRELALTDEELHIIVSAHTGKDSIKELSRNELGTVIGVLIDMKNSASRNGRGSRKERGNAGTANQRRKIYKLAQALGWEKPSRVNGMCRRMFGVACVEWLDYRQCSKLIEALKAMAEREEADKSAGLQAGNSSEGWGNPHPLRAHAPVGACPAVRGF